MKTFFSKMLLLAALISPALLNAHPGHGDHIHEDGFSIIHYFTQADHLIAIALIISVGIIAYRSRKAAKANQK